MRRVVPLAAIVQSKDHTYAQHYRRHPKILYFHPTLQIRYNFSYMFKNSVKYERTWLQHTLNTGA